MLSNRVLTIAKYLAILMVGLSVPFLILHRPDSQLHLMDAKGFCFESTGLEDAIISIKDILMSGLLQVEKFSEGYPIIQWFGNDLYPVSAVNLAEQHTSYRITLDKSGSVIELFYRDEDELDARFWPGYTIFVTSDCPGSVNDSIYYQRVHVFIQDIDVHTIVEKVLITSAK
jgi:hypothetical protein